MKKFFKILIIAIAMIACCENIYAQNHKQRISREQLAEAQAKNIAETLMLNDAASKQFIDTYCQCQKEIWALGPRYKARNQKSSTMSDAESEQAIKDRFEHSQKILNIRQKYYGEYSKFLTQKQIKQVYEQERQMMDRLSKRKANAKNGNRNRR